MKRRVEVGLLLAILLTSVGVFFAGICWGLPSRDVDPFLFGNHPVWRGEEIAKLAPPGREDAGRAADVSERPIDRDAGPVLVNSTDEDRARIVRRYRLMSHQPDEFTTFAALARMKPGRGDLDPRMYKYGGLWVYPVGALLKGAAGLRLIELRPDMTWYLDHPEAFGRFYVVARAYSACWGLVGVWAVYALVRRIAGDFKAALVAAACFALMPVVVNAAHEAKPHLAGAVLMLLGVLAAARYVEKGRGWIAAAVLCGAAVAMVPSALPVVLVIPAMFVLRSWGNPVDSLKPQRFPKFIARTGLAFALAGAVCLIANPFVAIHLFHNREVLQSNVGNSAAFYRPELSANGLANATLLIGEGCSFLLAVAGIVGAVSLGMRAWRLRRGQDEAEQRRRAAGLLLAIPALVVAGAFVLFAARQPADYARFALPFDLFLLIEAIVAVATFMRGRWRRDLSYGLLIASTGYAGHLYVHDFVRDSSPDTTRMQAAAEIRGKLSGGNGVLITPIEPAPWSMPPANLFEWKILFDAKSGTPLGPFNNAVSVSPLDVAPGPPALKRLTSTPISWACKPFEVTSFVGSKSRENGGTSR